MDGCRAIGGRQARVLGLLACDRMLHSPESMIDGSTGITVALPLKSIVFAHFTMKRAYSDR